MNDTFKIMTKSSLALVAAIAVISVASPAFALSATAHKHKQHVAVQGLQDRAYVETYAGNLDYQVITHGYPWAFR